jgi:hypothetical protein
MSAARPEARRTTLQVRDSSANNTFTVAVSPLRYIFASRESWMRRTLLSHVYWDRIHLLICPCSEKHLFPSPSLHTRPLSSTVESDNDGIAKTPINCSSASTLQHQHQLASYHPLCPSHAQLPLRSPCILPRAVMRTGALCNWSQQRVRTHFSQLPRFRLPRKG